MKFLVLVSVFVATTSAALQGYSLPTPGDLPPVPHTEGSCKEGEILHVDGTCIVPEVNRRVFVFDAPQQPLSTGPLPQIPPPKIHHNIMFVRIPKRGGGSHDPIVVPPPRQRNIVYVLNKQSDQGQQVIEVPAPPPTDPEVYFVTYDEDTSPTLPDGLDFQTALSSAVHGEGQLITAAGTASSGDVGGVSSFESSSVGGFDGHIATSSDLIDGSSDLSGAAAVINGGFVSSSAGGGGGGGVAATAPEPEAGGHAGEYFPQSSVITTEPARFYSPP